MGTDGEGGAHGSTRPDMNWHHTTGYGGDRDGSSYPGGNGYHPTRPGPPGYGRPGMWNGGDYGEMRNSILYMKKKI